MADAVGMPAVLVVVPLASLASLISLASLASLISLASLASLASLVPLASLASPGLLTSPLPESPRKTLMLALYAANFSRSRCPLAPQTRIADRNSCHSEYSDPQ